MPKHSGLIFLFFPIKGKNKQQDVDNVLLIGENNSYNQYNHVQRFAWNNLAAR